MEEMVALVIPALMAILLVRALFLPMKLMAKAAIHSLFGFACLWLLNLIAPFTGVALPVNAVTVLVAGFLGLPGIAVMTLLSVM